MNAQTGVGRPTTPSYWRHALIGAAFFALVGFLRAQDLVGTFLVEIGFIASGLVPHARRQEAREFHRGIRRVLGWVGTALSGLTITLLVIVTPVLLIFFGKFDFSQVIDGVVAIGYLGFTAYLFRTPVDGPAVPSEEQPVAF